MITSATSSRKKLRSMLQPLSSTIARLWARRWRGVRFLCYHSVCQPHELTELARRTGVISVDGFRRHLEVMREHGYRVVSMADALKLVANRAAGQGQYVCLTFDDGRYDNFVNAWPVLRDAGCSAHFFVSSALVGQTVHDRADREPDRYMDAEMLRAIVREGGSIGSHAHRHVNLTMLTRSTIRSELRESRRLLQDLVGRPVDTHAYPWAVYDRDVLAETRDAGYRYAFAGGVGGTVKTLDGDHAKLTIPRNTIRSGPDREENYVTVCGGMDVFSPYSTLKMRMRYRT